MSISLREPKPSDALCEKQLLVFSDDWGRHPSSCQHLISQLLPKYHVDWVNTMLNSGAGESDPGWTNFDCEDCGLVLPGDPRPNPLQPPFEQDGEDDRIVCE